MNICLLSSTALPYVGGLEIVVNNLATALTALGHNVFHVTPYPKKKITIADNYSYRVIRFGFRGDGRLKLVSATAIITMEYVVRRFKIDVINVHNVFSPGSWAYFYKRFKQSIPIIGTPHGDDVQITSEIQDGVRLDPKADRIVRRNLNAFDWITAISPSIRKDLNDLVNNKEKIVDIANGIWTKNYEADIDKKSVRKRFKISENAVVIISIGRNHPRKGFEYGVESVAMLKKAGFNVVYIIVGRAMEPIVKRAGDLSISDCLVTPGQVDGGTVSELLGASDIYMSPSIVESFGLSTLEAMSAGLPCVVTDIAGSRDLVSSEHGFLVEPRNADSIAKALKYLIENPATMQEMGRRSRREAQKYDWMKIAEKYAETYQLAITNASVSS
jgi:glycosyltransferase involved in cell wall biosynthesis